MSVATPASPCRFPLADPATVTDPVVRAVFGEIERELGFGIVPNVFRAMAGQPAVLRATWDLFRATVTVLTCGFHARLALRGREKGTPRAARARRPR